MSSTSTSSAVALDPKKGKLVHADEDFEVNDNLIEGCRTIEFENLFDTAVYRKLSVRGTPDGRVVMLLFMKFGEDKELEESTKAAFRAQDIAPNFRGSGNDVVCFRTSPYVKGQMTALLKAIDVIVGVPESHRQWLFDIAENPTKYCPKMTEEETEKLEAGKKRRRDSGIGGLLQFLAKASASDDDGDKPKAKIFRL